MNNTLCSRSWTDININFFHRKINHCCVAKGEKFPDILVPEFINNSPNIIQRRKDSLNGKQNDQCSYCWHEYKTAGTARRDHWNQWKSFEDISNEVKILVINLGNTCDMSCVYCDENSSSIIAKEKGKVVKGKFDQKDIDVFLSWFKSQDLRNLPHISFLGGELTVDKNFYYFLNKLKNIDVENLSISLTTNCNSKPENLQKLFNCFDQLPASWRITIIISNESIQPAELIRWGLDWNRFSENFQSYCNNDRINYLSLLPTISIFSIKYMQEYFAWAFDQVKYTNKKFMIIGNEVISPEVLDIANCPINYKKYINNCIELVKSNSLIFTNNWTSEELSLRKYDLNTTILWMKFLKKRIGSKEQKLEKLDNWFDTLYEQKKDKNIFKLKNFL